VSRTTLSKTTEGSAFGLGTALIWGAMFVIAKSALGRVDPFHLTAIRYLVASLVLLAALAVVEGPNALRLEGRGLHLAALGALGFAGFNLLAFTGLAHAPAQGAALITALAPLLTALVLWLRRGTRPSRSTLALLLVALAGVALVISHGDPTSLASGSAGWGDALVLAGVLCFIVYTIAASQFPGFSPLRFTALTAGLGWIVIAGATLAATLAGLEPEPSAGDVWAVAPQIAYIALLGAVVAVVAWNAAVGRIGPQNTALFGNLIPITTFTIEIARGYRPVALELVGAGITVAALLATNLLQRRAQSSSFSTKTSISPPQGRPTAQPSSSEMPYESSWGSPVSSTLRAHS
jgi:drug/metabolite transporter (DMT)-like permease